MTMESQEVWRSIPEYEGLFQVSNLGRVKGLARQTEYLRNGKCHTVNISEKILSEYWWYGFIAVSIHKPSGKRSKIQVHRAVAKSFLPNPNNYYVVTHKDGDRTNNRVDNLQWSKNSENYIGFTEQARQARRICCSIPVIQYGFDGKKIREFQSITEAAKSAEIQISQVSDCCKGRRLHCGGYQWRFKKV